MIGHARAGSPRRAPSAPERDRQGPCGLHFSARPIIATRGHRAVCSLLPCGGVIEPPTKADGGSGPSGRSRPQHPRRRRSPFRGRRRREDRWHRLSSWRWRVLPPDSPCRRACQARPPWHRSRSRAPGSPLPASTASSPSRRPMALAITKAPGASCRQTSWPFQPGFDDHGVLPSLLLLRGCGRHAGAASACATSTPSRQRRKVDFDGRRAVRRPCPRRKRLDAALRAMADGADASCRTDSPPRASAPDAR